ncbi:MAG: hypothetical protein ACRCWM_10235 [Sarcina sp.]
MKYDRESLNDPMREYVENMELENLEEERDLLREEELANEEEEFAVREEERIVAMEGFNPINTGVLEDESFVAERVMEDELIGNEIIQDGIIADDRLYNFEKERELEEDMDIIQAGKEPNW